MDGESVSDRRKDNEILMIADKRNPRSHKHHPPRIFLIKIGPGGINQVA